MPTNKILRGLPVPDTKRASIRWYFITGSGRIVRGLTFETYGQCECGGFPETRTMLLPADDPRPLGRRLYNSERAREFHTGEWLDQSAAHYDAHWPIGVWVDETIRVEREVPPYRDFTALALHPERSVA